MLATRTNGRHNTLTQAYTRLEEAQMGVLMTTANLATHDQAENQELLMLRRMIRDGDRVLASLMERNQLEDKWHARLHDMAKEIRDCVTELRALHDDRADDLAERVERALTR